MGYTSDVTIVCDKKTYKEIMDVLNECSMIPDKTWVNEKDHYRLWFYCVKWYYDASIRIEEIMRGLDGESGRFAMFLRNGEDFDDVVREEYGDYSQSDEYYPEVVLVVDEFNGVPIQSSPIAEKIPGVVARIEGIKW